MSLTPDKRQNVHNMIDMFEKKEQQSTNLRGGGGPPQRSGNTQIARFIAETLSEVLTTGQMKDMVRVGDPKFLNPPMTNSQRTLVTDKVMKKVLRPEQIKMFTETGTVQMNTLTPVQKNIIADLSAGYATGQILNLNQFRNFRDQKGLTYIGVDQALKLRPFTRIAGDPSPPVYNNLRTAASPHYMELGRIMDRPATDMVSGSHGRSLSGGAQTNSLIILKQQIQNMFTA